MSVNFNDRVYHALIEALKQLRGPINTLVDFSLVFFLAVHVGKHVFLHATNQFAFMLFHRLVLTNIL